MAEHYRIGVDVGGTNTDAALAAAVCELDSSLPTVKIIDSSKSPTTPDVTSGICAAVTELLQKTHISSSNVVSINIGTTHFINAIVQADSNKLRRVGVLRLCGPFCREVSPFADFPDGLREVIEGPIGFVDGGLEIDGRKIARIDEAQVERYAEEIIQGNISAVVINGVFSPLDTDSTSQEDQVKRILQRRLPGLDVVCSRDIGRVGYLERENAAILNGAILAFGRATIFNFQEAVRSLGLECPLYLTQNDGTVLDAYSASLAPIRTFSSGATNSLVGALFLSSLHDGKSKVNLEENQVIMCDIGGTTSDFAALSPSGLIRQSPATVKIGGVRTAFSMPETFSIGLGGGSLVEVSGTGSATVGPLSVGHLLKQKARCFGGTVLTATDIIAASGHAKGLSIDAQVVEGIDTDVVDQARLNIKKQLEAGVDIMRTSDRPVVLLLVGGGSIILQDELSNVAKCIIPPFFDVANAVGAAIAKISGDVDTIVIPGQKSHDEIKANITTRAVEMAVNNGAHPATVEVVELELIPLQYTNNDGVRAVAKAVGHLTWEKRENLARGVLSDPANANISSPSTIRSSSRSILPPALTRDFLASYRPNVSKSTGEWFVSPTDLNFISEGAGVLGTGGGGSVYTAYLNSLHALEKAASGRMRVVEPRSLHPDAKIAAIAYVGAPSVSNERLTGSNELQHAAEALSQYARIESFGGVLAAEIGGSNGMRTFEMAAAMDIPVVDADTMGRAFPRVDMSLPYVYQAATPAPAVVSDARGNVQVIARAENPTRFENLIRSISIELGLYTAMCLLLEADVVAKYCCHRSVSACWYIGRAIATARVFKTDIVRSLTDTIPGCQHVYSGKVISISRVVKGGWTIGTVEMSLDEEFVATRQRLGGDDKGFDERNLVMQFQNEFLFAALRNADATLSTVCTTPDLLAVLDQEGTAIGTHELRYGLRVNVVAMPADPLWKTAAGMKAGDPAAFGLDMQYRPYSCEWQKPKSVIEEFGV